MAQSKKNDTKENAEVIIDMDIGKEAIELVRGEWKAYENALVFVTDKVAFNIRALIKTLRKNYWGIPDNEKDPVTGIKITWVPLTEWICDTFVKNADRDAKDVRVKAKRTAYVGLAMLVRNLIQNWMSINIFGEEIDETERQIAIDGSHIWKMYKGYNEKGKPEFVRTDVDILNAYFDFTVKSIQKAPRFTERALMYPSDIALMDGWKNTEGIIGTTNLHPTDTNLTNSTTSSTKGAKMIDVWESWGKYPKYLITGKKEDVEQIDMHIVVSGLQGGADKARWHLIETNPGGKKPYEEAHTKRIKGRWLARGPAESVMMLQSWVNMIVNIRKIRASVSQLGIFKLKKSAGVSPQNVSRMAANGFIQVTNMDDIEQFVMEEASMSSYKDEEGAVNWAKLVTSSFEAVTGESTPASKSATGLVIESKAAGSTFVMYKKAIGFFLTRVFNNHGLPIMQEMLTEGDIVELSGSPEELAQYDNDIINCLAKQQLEKEIKAGKRFNPEQVFEEIEKAKKKFKRLGKDRYATLGKIDLTKYKVTIYVGDEQFDPEVLANNLANMLKVVPQYQDVIIKELFDLMGMDSTKIPDRAPMPPAKGGQPIAQQNAQQVYTEANT